MEEETYICCIIPMGIIVGIIWLVVHWQSFLTALIAGIIIYCYITFKKAKEEEREREEEKRKRERKERERERKEEEEKRKREREEREREKFEAEQIAKGLVKFISKSGKEKWVKPKEAKKLKEIDIGLFNNFQKLSAYEFEKFIAKLFQAMSYKTQLTPKTGDYGVDVIAKKQHDVVAIQCKKYGEEYPVSNRDVQRLLGAMRLKGIKATHGILITTSYFTVQAKEQAKGTPCELWDKHILHKMVKKYLMDI